MKIFFKWPRSVEVRCVFGEEGGQIWQRNKFSVDGKEGSAVARTEVCVQLYFQSF